MKWVTYGVAVTSGLLRLVVAVALLTHFSKPFERIVVDVLVLIFVTVDSLGISLGMSFVDQSNLSQRRLFEMAELVAASTYKDEKMKEYFAARDANSDQSVAKSMIRIIFVGLTYFAGLWSLVVDLVR